MWLVSLVPYPKSCTLHHSVMGALVFGTISHVGLTTWGPELEKRHLSPGVVWSLCGRSAWSRTVSLHTPPLCGRCSSTPSRGSGHTTWLPRLKSCVHMLLHSSSKQTYVITFPYKRGPSSIYAGMNCAAPAGVVPEAGSERPHRRRRPPLHQRIAGGSDHICTSSDNHLHSERLTSGGDHLRVCAIARRSSPPSSYGG
jgi:hypothetical protein